MASRPTQEPVLPAPPIGRPEGPSPAARPRIGRADHGRSLTLQEFVEAEEEPGYRYELARGVLEVTEVPNDPHAQVEWNLLAALRDHQRAHPGLIRRCGASGSVRLWLPGMVSGRNPDVAVVLQGAPKDQRGRRIPALVAEVVSSGGEARDYEIKRQEYLAYGLLEYWIVDPQKRRVTVLARRGDVWEERAFEGDQRIESLILPDLAATVADLWADLDDDPEPRDA